VYPQFMLMCSCVSNYVRETTQAEERLRGDRMKALKDGMAVQRWAWDERGFVSVCVCVCACACLYMCVCACACVCLHQCGPEGGITAMQWNCRCLGLCMCNSRRSTLYLTALLSICVTSNNVASVIKAVTFACRTSPQLLYFSSIIIDGINNSSLRCAHR
jgi:hypothetical protein